MSTKATEKNLPFHKERGQFHEPLLANPNSFGNLEKSPFKPVKKVVYNTSYEQVTCVALNPLLRMPFEFPIRLFVGRWFRGDGMGSASAPTLRTDVLPARTSGRRRR